MLNLKEQKKHTHTDVYVFLNSYSQTVSIPSPIDVFTFMFGNGNLQAIIFVSLDASLRSFRSKSFIIDSTPNMTTILYFETSNFHRSFLKNLVFLKTPWYRDENREYWTSQVLYSTPCACAKPCFAAAVSKNTFQKHKYTKSVGVQCTLISYRLQCGHRHFQYPCKFG